MEADVIPLVETLEAGGKSRLGRSLRNFSVKARLDLLSRLLRWVVGAAQVFHIQYVGAGWGKARPLIGLAFGGWA